MTSVTTTGKPSCEILQFPERAKAPSGADQLKSLIDLLDSPNALSLSTSCLISATSPTYLSSHVTVFSQVMAYAVEIPYGQSGVSLDAVVAAGEKHAPSPALAEAFRNLARCLKEHSGE